jgi:CheY-like chemotaxis protein
LVLRNIISAWEMFRHRVETAAYGEDMSVPVIHITGNNDPPVREAALWSGCLAYLTKPFSVTSLAEKLRQAAEVNEPVSLNQLDGGCPMQALIRVELAGVS